jgi:hypothetical protein
MKKKTISTKISESTEAFLQENFTSKGYGASFCLTAFAGVFKRTVHHFQNNLFTKGELSLFIDIMNGTILSPELSGQIFKAQVEDSITLDHMDRKWGVKADTLLQKLEDLSPSELMILEIWARAFWKNWENQDKRGKDLTKYIGRPLEHINIYHLRENDLDAIAERYEEGLFLPLEVREKIDEEEWQEAKSLFEDWQKSQEEKSQKEERYEEISKED